MSAEQIEPGIDGNASLVAAPRRIHLTSGQKIGVAALVAFVFLAFIWIDASLHSKNAADKEPDLGLKSNAAYRPAPITVPPPPPAPSVQQVHQAPPPAVKQDTSAADSPIFAYSTNVGASLVGTGTPLASTGAAIRPIVPSLLPAGGEAGGSGSLGSKLKPTVLDGVKASMLPHPDMLITKGTIIPCTLQTAINSELAGFVKCVLPEAVRSTTGNVVLLDRGTTIVGEIQSGLAQGQDRVFILWDRAETPGHAVVSLASPGADELGRAGNDGAVNNHFWERFGNAIMLSVIQSGLQAGTAMASNSGSGNGTYFTNFQTNGQQLADTSLQNSINIPPTLEKNQGDNVSIFVARDLDFSSVYSLSLDK